MAEKPPNVPVELWKGILYAQGKIDRQAALNWLNLKWTANRNCPICTQINWGVGEELLRLWDTKLHPTYPCITVICQTCGYTMLFNAKVMNLLPPKKP